jgi:sec-independent protein translocase protein TatA
MRLPIAILPNLAFPEIFLILLVVLVLFGGRKLPELARSLGNSINQFKRGLKEQADETDKIAPPKEGETKEP